MRRIEAMINVCQTHRPDPMELFNGPEDAWLSEHVTEYPDLDFRSNHIMESIHVDDPYIIHQPWTFAHCYQCFEKGGFIECWRRMLHIG